MLNEVLNNYGFSNILSMAINNNITFIYNSHHKLNKKYTSFINLFLIGIIIFHRSKVTELFFRTIHLTSLQKIPQFHVISWCGNFGERHSFRIFLSKIIFSLLWECEKIGATLLTIQLRCKTNILKKTLWSNSLHFIILSLIRLLGKYFILVSEQQKCCSSRTFHQRNWRKKYCREKMVIPSNKGLV